jgi:hypothetical protein
MKKITGYYLVIEKKPQRVMIGVNEALKEGWELYGGLVSYKYMGDWYLIQPMVLRKGR